MTYRVSPSRFTAIVFFVVTISWGTMSSCQQLPANFDLPLIDSSLDSPFRDESIASRKRQPQDTIAAFPNTRNDLLEIEKAAIAVAQKAQTCTVGIRINATRGSGVIISEDGYVLTAEHISSRPGRRVEIRFADGRTTTGIALGVHTSADGGLIKIEDEDAKWDFMPLATKEQAAKPGDWCVGAGHPGGFDADRPPPIRLGRVIDVLPTMIRTDCPIMGGDSGGPLFDLQGRVIGIHSRLTDERFENLHASSNAFHEAWDHMLLSMIYPAPIPSTLLSELDSDKNGTVTRSELKSDYHGRVFERLVEAFELEGNEIPIKSVARDLFRWRNHVAAGVVENDKRSRVILPERDYCRGPMMKRLVERSLREADGQSQDVDEEYVNQQTVRVYLNGRRVSLGTVVDKTGLVLTKLSRVVEKGAVSCRLPSGKKQPAEIIATDDGYDLALLQIAPADQLSDPIWNLADVQPGQIVAIPRNGGNLESLGVTSVAPREIKTIRPYLGIVTDNKPNGEVHIMAVAQNSGAEQAGVKVGDILRRVGDDEVKSMQDIHRILHDYRAGDEIEIRVERDGNAKEIDVLLLSQYDMDFPGMNNWALRGDDLSRVRDGFLSAFQIDALVIPQSCGGPVVDLNGQVLGITLARSNRIATFAISAKDLNPVLERMRSEAETTLRAKSTTIQE